MANTWDVVKTEPAGNDPWKVVSQEAADEPSFMDRLVADLKVFAHLRAAQVEVTVFQAKHLAGVGVVVDHEGRSLGRGKHVQLAHRDLDLAGRRLHRRADHRAGCCHCGAGA